GIVLNQEQLALIIKFAPYFDGVHVLETEQEEVDGEEESLKGMFNEFKTEFKSMFVGAKAAKSPEFYLYEYLEKYYESKLDSFIIPDVESVVEAFIKTVIPSTEAPKVEEPIKNDAQANSNCTHCQAT